MGNVTNAQKTKKDPKSDTEDGIAKLEALALVEQLRNPSLFSISVAS